MLTKRDCVFAIVISPFGKSSKMHHHNKEKFEEICVLIKNVDTNDDAIMQTLKLRTIGEKFRSAIKDEKLLR